MSKRRGQYRRQRNLKPGPENLAARARGDVVHVDRKTALVRLLDTAIIMWFFERDPLAIHLITCAAYNCLCALGKNTNKGPVLKARVDKLKFATAYDFLRHATSNPKDSLDFAPRGTGFVLFDAVASFDRIFGGVTVYMETFIAFYPLFCEPTADPGTRQKLVEDFTAVLPQGTRLEDAAKWSRVEFFDRVTEMYGARRGITAEPRRYF